MNNETNNNLTKKDMINWSILAAVVVAALILVLVVCNRSNSDISDMVSDYTESTVSTTTEPIATAAAAVETTESTTAPVDITEPTIASVTIPEETIPETEEEIYEREEEPEETYVEDIPEPTEAPEEDDSEYYMSETEMLACVIYQEAGGEVYCDDCRRRVADVVLNRVASDSFPNTIYEVLTQYAQYGRFYWTGIVWPDRAYDDYEAEYVAKAWQIAEEVLAGQHSEVYGNGYIWQAEFEQGTDGFWCCGHFFGR